MPKTGLRKLCDVPDGKDIALESELKRLGIWYRTWWMDKDDRDFLRYFVNARDLARATDALPLSLRGWRAVAPGPEFPPEPPEAA